MISCITLLLLEVVYRYGVIDFYKAEISALNPIESIESDTVDVLVFGDSFSAPETNYVNKLRDAHKEITFLNLGIPGTGIKQVNTFARKKIKRYTPKHIIYQVYVGNDLLDVKHLSGGENISFSRNFYWKLTDHIWSGIYVNQKLKMLKSQKASGRKGDTNALFSTSLYTKRQQMLFNADARYLDKTIRLQDDFLDRYGTWKKQVTSFLEVIPEGVTVSIVFIPHCAQVNDRYYENMESIGAKFEDKTKAQDMNYPFYTKAVQDFKEFDQVTFYNPISYLRAKETDTHRLYYANDPHFNENGQHAFYEFLEAVIFEK
ncbi:hypothetical protein [uncultured Dokdonia sp.]|uniref:hypothetical protein n=1 Tax=uncultured Dokdonia sp. TaxID=575653 RepID=UPI00262C08C5|nr:hypothetical protein [uncultured Dokdonia sp.]